MWLQVSTSLAAVGRTEEMAAAKRPPATIAQNGIWLRTGILPDVRPEGRMQIERHLR
jgi:hypothetical protein